MTHRDAVRLPLLALWLACGSSAALPETLLGVWRHPDAAYSDRTLEVRADVLVFNVGHVGEVFPIVEVEVDERGEDTVCTVKYRLPGGALMPLRLVYMPTPEPQLRLGSREGIWSLVERVASEGTEERS